MRTILGAEAKAMGREDKWALLSPFLKQHGRQGLSYATLQTGMEYFLDDTGYIAFTSVRHPVFARNTKRIVFSDPICSAADLPKIIGRFLSEFPHSVFAVISEECCEVLRSMRFKINCIGVEPEIPVQTYNTNGNWKELDLIKRARNEAKREGIVIREETPENLDPAKLAAVSARWMANKKLNDREIWLYARRPVFEFEEDVRKFVAYDKEGTVVGFVFYDPMYRDGRVVGYSANISRCDEERFGRLSTAVNMAAVDKFKTEGKEVLNLLLAPFVELHRGKYNDDLGAKLFFLSSARYGNEIYNFKGLSFHKFKYRTPLKPCYLASASLIPSNDIYLAFLSADIARNYWGTVFKLLQGMVVETARWRPWKKT
jgi:lysylphosphatidylglycerol synthetase-like protein (DUF2156 family)